MLQTLFIVQEILNKRIHVLQCESDKDGFVRIDLGTYNKATGFKSCRLSPDLWINDTVLCERSVRAPWGFKTENINAKVIGKWQGFVCPEEKKFSNVKKSSGYKAALLLFRSQFEEKEENN